jgi:metal transporter CNNM
MACVGFARGYRTKPCSAYCVSVSLLLIGLLNSIGVDAQLNGFRVESCDETAAWNTAGRVSIVGGRDVTIRVFTVDQLTTSAQISFTTVVAERNTNCDDLRVTAIFSLSVDESESGNIGKSSSARAVIRLPEDRAVYMFCMRRWSNSSSVWEHQGNASWLQLGVTGPVSPAKNWLPVWASIVIIAVLVAVSALCTALGVETLSLSRSEIKMLRSCGVSDERRFAKAIGPFRKRGNRILCGLLFSSLFVNAAVAVLIEDMLQLPGAAMIIAASILLMFGALLPMIVSSKVGLLAAAKSSWLVNIFVVIAFPFSFPLGRLMDWFLADDLPCVCNRSRLQCIHQSSQTSAVMKEEEKDEAKAGGSKSLRLSDKCVGDLMTKIENVFMVEYNGILDEKTLERILASGYTRIPVYEKDPKNVVALLHVRDLAYVHASDRTSLRTLCKFYNHPVNFVFEDTKLGVMLEEFKKGN